LNKELKVTAMLKLIVFTVVLIKYTKQYRHNSGTKIWYCSMCRCEKTYIL